MSGARRDVGLVISDVDGTLVLPDKSLSPRTIAAVQALHRAGIGFAVTSSRPPRGMAGLVGPLGIRTFLCGFNGGLIVTPDQAPVEGAAIPSPAARRTLAFLAGHGIETWLFDQHEWYVRDATTQFCARERRTVAFEPTVTADLDALAERAYKIVGASDDHDGLARCEAALREELGDAASASRSQAYYLDVTAREANKGRVVHALSRLLSVPPARIAVIGDGPNDVAMFREAGFAVAMGQAAPETRAAAGAVTASNAQDGFAEAMTRYILDDETGGTEAAR